MTFVLVLVMNIMIKEEIISKERKKHSSDNFHMGPLSVAEICLCEAGQKHQGLCSSLKLMTSCSTTRRRHHLFPVLIYTQELLTLESEINEPIPMKSEAAESINFSLISKEREWNSPSHLLSFLSLEDQWSTAKKIWFPKGHKNALGSYFPPLSFAFTMMINHLLRLDCVLQPWDCCVPIFSYLILPTTPWGKYHSFCPGCGGLER